MIDIYGFDKQLVNTEERIKCSSISERNKELILSFEDALLLEVGKPRTLKYLRHLVEILKIYKKDLDWLNKKEIQGILKTVKTDQTKGEWTYHDIGITLRRFLKWLRNEIGYPEEYNNNGFDKEKCTELLQVLDYPIEISKFKFSKPKDTVTSGDIPTKQEIRYLIQSALNARDIAIISILEEVGLRIGDLGHIRIKDISFDEIGAKISIFGKSQSGETIRLIDSVPALKNWLQIHPFKDKSEAPLCIDLSKTEKPIAMKYGAMRSMIKRTIARHNRKAKESNGRIPLIIKKFNTHVFRYYAQTRDEELGIPRSVQCKQRGWSPTSKQPDRYAKLSTKKVDEVLMKKRGLSLKQNVPKIIQCKECSKINPETANFCSRCEAPLDINLAVNFDSLEKRIEQLETYVENFNIAINEMADDSELRNEILPEFKREMSTDNELK